MTPELSRFRDRPPAPRRPARRVSTHVVVRDGTALAVDVTLPRDLAPGERLPAILRSTRYHRAVALRGPLDGLPVPRPWDRWWGVRQRFLDAGYAWVDVDARGSGASQGSRPCPWSPDEVRDGADLVDYIIAQPWSNGRAGALGVSYDGTASEMLLANGHPAVRAVAPLFSLHDVYADVAFPGGVHLAWFTEAWARFNRTLDDNRFDVALAQIIGLIAQARLAGAPLPPRAREAAAALAGRALPRALRPVLGAVIDGVRRVDGDRAGARLAAALADHARNVSVHEGALRLTYRDDRGLVDALPEGTIDTFSPHAHADAIARSGAAIYSVSGWLDGGYARSAVARYDGVRTPGSRLLVGPWTHAGMLRMVPFGAPVPVAFDLASELLDFFDLHLRDRPGALADAPPVRWAALGRDGAAAWRSAATFPPPGVAWRALHLGPARALRDDAPARDGADAYAVDRALGTGLRSRWRGLLSLVPADYPDHGARDARRLAYTGAPLDADVELAGAPRVTVHVRADAADATVFAYLADVAPDGRVQYVTEGALRALHRAHRVRDDGVLARTFLARDGAPLEPGGWAELVFDLQPTAYVFRRGHRVRLSLACADRDHFAAPPDALRGLDVGWGPSRPSRVALPVFGA